MYIYIYLYIWYSTHCHDPSPLLVPWSWKGRAIPLLPLWAVRPVQSLSACTGVTFTLPQCLYKGDLYLLLFTHFQPVHNLTCTGPSVIQLLCRYACVCIAFKSIPQCTGRNKGSKSWNCHYLIILPQHLGVFLLCLASH